MTEVPNKFFLAFPITDRSYRGLKSGVMERLVGIGGSSGIAEKFFWDAAGEFMAMLIMDGNATVASNGRMQPIEYDMEGLLSDVSTLFRITELPETADIGMISTMIAQEVFTGEEDEWLLDDLEPYAEDFEGFKAAYYDGDDVVTDAIADSLHGTVEADPVDVVYSVEEALQDSYGEFIDFSSNEIFDIIYRWLKNVFTSAFSHWAEEEAEWMIRSSQFNIPKGSTLVLRSLSEEQSSRLKAWLEKNNNFNDMYRIVIATDFSQVDALTESIDAVLGLNHG